MDFKKHIPLYYQISEMINEKIETSEWKPGYQIPAENELCELFGVSRITVRKAIEELTHLGKLVKHRGRGTFVLDKHINQNLKSIYSFSQEMERQGKISSTKVVSIDTINADQKLAKKLDVQVGEPLIKLSRLRLADEIPVVLEDTYFVQRKYSKLLEYDLNNFGLYKLLETEFNVHSTRAEERFRACELTDQESILLLCNKGSYGLVVQRTLYQDEEIVCWSNLVSKGDIFEFNVVLYTN